MSLGQGLLDSSLERSSKGPQRLAGLRPFSHPLVCTSSQPVLHLPLPPQPRRILLHRRLRSSQSTWRYVYAYAPKFQAWLAPCLQWGICSSLSQGESQQCSEQRKFALGKATGEEFAAAAGRGGLVDQVLAGGGGGVST